MLKDIQKIERVQRRATKYVLNDYENDYKQRLIKLHLLPIMYFYELQDIMYLVKCIKHPPDNFELMDYITFATSNTRFGTSNKLKYNFRRTVSTKHFYFNRIVKLWNFVPPIDTSLTFHSIKSNVFKFFWSYFLANFDPEKVCSYHVLCPCSKSVVPVSEHVLGK